MANTFNNQVTSAINTSSTEIYTGTNLDASGDVGIVIGLIVSNDHATDDTQVTIMHKASTADGGAETEVAKLVKIPVNTSIEFCRGNKFVVKNGEKLTALRSSSGTANAMVSVLEITS